MNKLTLHCFTDGVSITSDADLQAAYDRWAEENDSPYTRYFTVLVEVPEGVPSALITLPVEQSPTVSLA